MKYSVATRRFITPVLILAVAIQSSAGSSSRRCCCSSSLDQQAPSASPQPSNSQCTSGHGCCCSEKSPSPSEDGTQSRHACCSCPAGCRCGCQQRSQQPATPLAPTTRTAECDQLARTGAGAETSTSHSPSGSARMELSETAWSSARCVHVLCCCWLT